MSETSKRKYVCIAKVNNNTFVKYRCNDLQNFIKFITLKYNCFYFNVFSNKMPNKGILLYTWGSRKGLEPAK